MKIILDRGQEDRSFMTQYTVAPFLVRNDNGLFLREKDITSGESDRYMVWDTKSNTPKPADEPGVEPALEGTFTAGDQPCRPAFDLLVDVINQYPLEKASDITGIAPERIENLAMAYAADKPVATYRGLGMQRTFHGDLAFRAVSTLAALTGNMLVERGPRGIVMQAEDFLMVDKKPFKTMPVLQMYDAIEKETPYPIKALYIGATNFVNQNAHANKIVNELFPRLDFIVVHELFMNATAEQADLVLPGCTFYEYTDMCATFSSPEPYVLLQQPVIEPLYEAKCPQDVVNGLAAKMGLGEHFTKTNEEYIEQILASGHPSLEGLTLEKLKQGPMLSPPYEVPLFANASGRIEFYSEAMKPFDQALPIYREPLESNRSPLAEKYPLTLTQSHMKYVKNSTLANVSWMRELNPEPVLEMNPQDAGNRGIQDGDTVVAFNDRGRVKLKAIVHQGVRPGNVDLHQGWWPRDYKEGSHQELTQCELNPAQAAGWEPNMAVFDNLVEVRKEGA
jgi:molybdopterin-containing oxidoreductase family molybdopterin binding subunit